MKRLILAAILALSALAPLGGAITGPSHAPVPHMAGGGNGTLSPTG